MIPNLKPAGFNRDKWTFSMNVGPSNRRVLVKDNIDFV